MEPMNSRMVKRNRLMRLAGQMPDGIILYVYAPAGYGKTVFATQWLEGQAGADKMLVTFDEYDNTVEDICRKLKSIPQHMGNGLDPTAASQYAAHPDFDKAPVEFLMRAAAAIPRECTGAIAFDDLHHLSSPPAQKILLDFLARLPACVAFCILSRHTPPKQFSGLVLKNKIQFLTPSQLLFDSNEIHVFYRNSGASITKEQVDSILSATEGWPIGIQAMLLSENCLPSEKLPRDWLDNFLETQVWPLWEEELREFMVSSCIEEQLCESLCDALTGNTGSGAVLEQLWTEGAFLTRLSDGIYRFHRLFRKFLKKQFASRPQAYRIRKIRAAGAWYQSHQDFYHAVERFSWIKDYADIARCFDGLETLDRASFDTEQVMRAVGLLNEEIADHYPYLYYMMAFTARNEGRLDDFQSYADRYYENYPRITARNPELAHNIFFLYMLDFRIPIRTIFQRATSMSKPVQFQGVRGTATSYFPFYHRSFRDFTELLSGDGDIDAEMDLMEQTLGPLMGEEQEMLYVCIRAGLSFEKGNLGQAHELALAAISKMQDNFTPESKFCVMALLLAISHALPHPTQEKDIQDAIQRMIENEKAFYLQENFNGLLCRNRMEYGDTEAASKWLESHGTGCQDMDGHRQIEFFRLYGHFVTARAYIVLGNFEQAVILLEKLLELSRKLRRPMDVIEAEILLAIAFGKKNRRNHKKAMFYLSEAVKTAQPMGCVQVFINEGAGLENMLYILKNRTVRSDYEGELKGTFVRKIYYGASNQAQLGKGLLCGSTAESTIQFTTQQKKVAKLMCEGYSYRRIGEELGIQFSTVRSHIELIYRKLDVSNMKDAIIKIQKLSLLEP